MAEKVYIETYGCQQNEADSERLMGLCLSCGYIQAETPEEADLILVNTCAVREHAELKALSNTGRFKAQKMSRPELLLGVCGCMPQQEHRAELLRKKYPFVDFVFGPNRIADLPAILDEVKEARKKERHRRVNAVQDFNTCPGGVSEGLPVCHKNRYNAYVPIMSGCNNFCTYCVVPYVRGREQSREPRAVFQEVSELVANGYREITLLGQNVNSYGKNLEPQESFASLLRSLDQIEGDFVLRFMTPHPKDMSHETVDVIASSRHIAPQIHLPLQSGSDTILKRMHRIYTRDEYLDLCDYIKKAIPLCTLTTDVIIGFPGETDEDFEDTLSVLGTVRYDNLFSFLYSPREGTPAATYEGRISQETMRVRMDRLLALQRECSLENNERFVHKTLRCLVEGESKTAPETLTARSVEGKIVHFPKTPDAVLARGTFVPLTITKAESTLLHAAAYRTKESSK